MDTLLIRKLKIFFINLEHVILSKVMTLEIKVLKKMKYTINFIVAYYA